MRWGTVVYPREFVERLPQAGLHEDRLVIQLLKGEHACPEREIERIERWHAELDAPPERKATLLGNLRSDRPRNFWSGLHELMTSRVFVERGWRATYEPDISGKTPDFFVRTGEGHEFIAEVLTVFDAPDDQRAEEQAHFLAGALDDIKHRLGVLVEDVRIPDQVPSLAPILDRIKAWLDTCGEEQSETLRLELPESPIAATLTTAPPPRPEPEPIVVGIVGVGGEITTHETIWTGIRKKAKKYQAVKSLGLPLVLFLWAGHWLKVTHTSLEWALFGQEQVRFARGPDGIIGKGEWGRAPGGLFGFGHDGKGEPRHTTVSAIAFAQRVPHGGEVYANMRLYHHAYAAYRLVPQVFSGLPQCLPRDVSPDRVSWAWDRQLEGLGLLLR